MLFTVALCGVPCGGLVFCADSYGVPCADHILVGHLMNWVEMVVGKRKSENGSRG